MIISSLVIEDGNQKIRKYWYVACLKISMQTTQSVDDHNDNSEKNMWYTTEI